MWVQLYALVCLAFQLRYVSPNLSELFIPVNTPWLMCLQTNQLGHSQNVAFVYSASREELDRRRDEVLGVIDQLKVVIHRASLCALAQQHTGNQASSL
jgi:hypothetical protein